MAAGNGPRARPWGPGSEWGRAGERPAGELRVQFMPGGRLAAEIGGREEKLGAEGLGLASPATTKVPVPTPHSSPAQPSAGKENGSGSASVLSVNIQG